MSRAHADGTARGPATSNRRQPPPLGATPRTARSTTRTGGHPMYRRSSRRRLAALGLIAISLAATLATAGCGAADSSDKSSSAGAPQAEGAAPPGDANSNAEKDMSAGG